MTSGASSSNAAVECITTRERATALLEHPLRTAILDLASEPRSATEIAATLGEARQKVNYHVRRLHTAGLLVAAERRQRRGLTEQRYVATARSYVLGPGVMGAVRADPSRVADRMSADYLMALAQRVEGDLATVRAQAAQANQRVATMSISADIRFRTAAERERFATELQKAIGTVIARFSSPDKTADGRPAAGRPFRLVAGCYPRPRDATTSTSSAESAP